MTFRCCLIVAIALFSCLASCPAQDSKTDPREKLETAIPEAIRLLEAKDYTKLLKNFVKPEDFKRITESQPLEAFARQFGKDKSDNLLTVLKSIKDVKPKLEDEGEKAVFTLKEAVGGKDKITFEKVDKFWYIAD